MIISALIGQCRREYRDNPKTVRVSRQGNGTINLFNVGKFPVVEGSYTIYLNTSAKTETSHYIYDLDNGDLRFVSTPTAGQEVISQHKYAEWRDKNWVEALNQGIEELNARGYFRQVVRAAYTISANIQSSAGPSACIDLYEVLVSDNGTTSGNFARIRDNWEYQQDANKIVLANKPTIRNYAKVSYLRNLQTYSATSATIDSLNDWLEIIKKKAGAIFFRSLAAKIAMQGNATVDEGHFSFTNCRTMANDLETEVERLAIKKKPTRPAKDIQFKI